MQARNRSAIETRLSRVDVCLRCTHFSRRMWNASQFLVQDGWSANPSHGRCHLPHNFRRSYEYLIRYQSEDFSGAHEVVFIGPHNHHVHYWRSMDSILWACIPISLKHMLFWCMFLDPHLVPYQLNYRCPYYCYVGIRYLYLCTCQKYIINNKKRRKQGIHIMIKMEYSAIRLPCSSANLWVHECNGEIVLVKKVDMLVMIFCMYVCCTRLALIHFFSKHQSCVVINLLGSPFFRTCFGSLYIHMIWVHSRVEVALTFPCWVTMELKVPKRPIFKSILFIVMVQWVLQWERQKRFSHRKCEGTMVEKCHSNIF